MRLRRQMAVAGVTPEQLAKDAGVGKSTVTRALRGDRMSITSLLKLSATLAGYPKNAALEQLLPDGPEAA